MQESPPNDRPALSSDRIVGFDVARAIAILGMVVVHFSLVLGRENTGPPWLEVLLGFLDGRAATTFVILAGIGLTLLSRKAVSSGNAESINSMRRVFVRRGLALLLLGFINLAIWPGDILRVYGVSLVIAAGLIESSSRQLITAAIAFALAFVVVLMLVDFEENWDWETLTYRNLWTVTGLLRNLFYDGFRSVLPWTGLLLFGMWLGRLDFSRPDVRRRVFFSGIIVAVVTELISWRLVSYFRGRTSEFDPETVNALLGTGSMPALPLFLLASGGTALAVIAGCTILVANVPGRWSEPLANTGQLALTWYFGHIVIGLGSIVLLDLENSRSQAVAAGWGVVFYLAAVLLSWLWRQAFRNGPIETVLRKLSFT